MNKKLSLLIVISLIPIALLLNSCLVSGTFVIVEKFNIATANGFLGEAVDITTNDIWEDHQDKLDNIEQIGFELWMVNDAPSDWKFWASLDDYNIDCVNSICAMNSSTKFLIFDTIAYSAGSGEEIYISYEQSLKYLRNTPQALKMLMEGKFNFFGRAQNIYGGGAGRIDSIRVVITLNASDS